MKIKVIFDKYFLKLSKNIPQKEPVATRGKIPTDASEVHLMK